MTWFIDKIFPERDDYRDVVVAVTATGSSLTALVAAATLALEVSLFPPIFGDSKSGKGHKDAKVIRLQDNEDFAHEYLTQSRHERRLIV